MNRVINIIIFTKTEGSTRLKTNSMNILNLILIHAKGNFYRDANMKLLALGNKKRSLMLSYSNGKWVYIFSYPSKFKSMNRFGSPRNLILLYPKSKLIWWNPWKIDIWSSRQIPSCFFTITTLLLKISSMDKELALIALCLLGITKHSCLSGQPIVFLWKSDFSFFFFSF